VNCSGQIRADRLAFHPSAKVRIWCALVSLTACAAQAPAPEADGGGLVHWLGLDSRPLAVGSRLIVDFEIASDGGEQPTYTVAVDAPDVIGVEDLGEEQLLLSVLQPGTATLQLQTSDGPAAFPITAFNPARVTFSDADHLAASIDVPLAPTFDLLGNAQEVLQGVVLDADGGSMNSWGLTDGSASSFGLNVSKREPEQLILASAGTIAGPVTVVVGLADGGVPQSYTVYIVNSAASVRLATNASASNFLVLAEALDNVGKTVFGVDDWQFECSPSATCIVNRVSASAVQLALPAEAFTSGRGSYTLTAVSPSQALTGSLQVP
jgi:hypothetical protein